MTADEVRGMIFGLFAAFMMRGVLRMAINGRTQFRLRRWPQSRTLKEFNAAMGQPAEPADPQADVKTVLLAKPPISLSTHHSPLATFPSPLATIPPSCHCPECESKIPPVAFTRKTIALVFDALINKELLVGRSTPFLAGMQHGLREAGALMDRLASAKMADKADLGGG